MPRRKSAADYDEEIRQLRERQRDARARERREERKSRDHAAFVAGGLILGCFPDGWQSVDWDTLARQIRAAGPAFAKMVVPEEDRPADTKEATAMLREWEKKDRMEQQEKRSTASNDRSQRVDCR